MVREHGIDVAVFQKRYSDSDIELAESLKSHGIRICFDLCDNLLYSLELTGDLDRRRNLQTMIGLADVVTVPTATLGESFSSYHVAVVDDAIETKARPRTRTITRWPRRRRLRVVWFGTAGSTQPHFGLPDLAEAIGELERLDARMPLHLGVISNDRESYERFVRTDAFPHRYHSWSTARAHARIAASDVCVLPTTINPFTVGKSANRAVLSLLLGTPVVATPLPAYAELEDLLAIGTCIGVVIDDLLAQPVRTRDRVEHAQRVLPDRFAPVAVVKQWSRVFRELA